MKEDIVHFYVPQKKVPFYLEMAGISYCDGSYRMRRQESSETVLEYIVEGCGYLNVNGENYMASAGDAYILRKRTNHVYRSEISLGENFFNIRGSLAEKLLDEYQLGSGDKVVLNAQGLEQDFREMLEHVSDSTVAQSRIFDWAAVDFLEMLIKLSDIDKLRSQNNGELMSAQDEMNRLIEYITMNQRRLVSNQELADHIFRSKNYVIKRFCTEFGVTPYEYQIQQKIFSARNLLENTKLSVKEITDLIGYGDQHYFSAMFKKRCGISPAQYRKKVQRAELPDRI